MRCKQKTETKEISEWRQDRVVLCEIAGGRNVIAQGVSNWNLPHGNGVRRDVATTNLEPNVIIKRFEWCPFTYWSTVYTADQPRIDALNASKRDRLRRIQGTVIQRCITCHFKRYRVLFQLWNMRNQLHCRESTSYLQILWISGTPPTLLPPRKMGDNMTCSVLCGRRRLPTPMPGRHACTEICGRTFVQRVFSETRNE